MYLQLQEKQMITNYKYYLMIVYVFSMKYNIFIEYFSSWYIYISFNYKITPSYKIKLNIWTIFIHKL